MHVTSISIWTIEYFLPIKFVTPFLRSIRFFKSCNFLFLIFVNSVSSRWTGLFMYFFYLISNLVSADINECASSPCQNGATCADHVNRYKCSCVAGFSGINCEISKYLFSSLAALYYYI